MDLEFIAFNFQKFQQITIKHVLAFGSLIQEKYTGFVPHNAWINDVTPADFHNYVFNLKHKIISLSPSINLTPPMDITHTTTSLTGTIVATPAITPTLFTTPMVANPTPKVLPIPPVPPTPAAIPVPAVNPLQVSSSTVNSTPLSVRQPNSFAADFKKTTKRDKSIDLEFKDKKMWDTFQRHLIIQVQADGISNQLNPNFIPMTTED